MTKRKYIIYPICIALLIGLDMMSKLMATAYLKPIGRMPFIPGLELVYVLNDGAAFSLFAGNTFFLIVLTSISILALIVILFSGRFDKLFYEICFVLIISGGIGNLIDRITTGVVVDFFNFTFVNFAVFNVADCYVTVGVALFAIYYTKQEFFSGKKREEN